MTKPWDNLSAEQFEEFCYHILRLSDFQDLKWLGRKGSDKGRDITATKTERPFDRQFYCNEFEEVGFVVMNGSSADDALHRVLEFVSFIKANEIKTWKPKNRKTKP